MLHSAGRRGGARRLRDGVRRRPPSQLGPAGEGDKRAALWLGPDEWLLIGDSADAAAIAEVLESVLEGTAHISSTSRIARSASSPAAGRGARPQRRLPARSKPQGLSGRLRDAHAVRQSGDRALAPRSGDLPCRSLALVCALSRGVARRGGPRRAGMVTGGWNEERRRTLFHDAEADPCARGRHLRKPP